MTSDYCRIVVHWGVRFLQKEGEPRNTILPPRALWWPPLLRRWRSTAHRHSTPYSSSSCRNPGYSQGTAEKLGTTKTCIRDSVIEAQGNCCRDATRFAHVSLRSSSRAQPPCSFEPPIQQIHCTVLSCIIFFH